MATQDVVVTYTMKWANATVIAMGLVPQKDSSIMIEVHGTTQDANGNLIQLKPAQVSVQPGQVPAVDNMLARALIELRKANGLEV